MFYLIRFALEIITNSITAVFKYNKSIKNNELGKYYIELIKLIQEILLKGYKIVDYLENIELIKTEASSFTKLIQDQTSNLTNLKLILNDLKPYITISDPALYVDFTPLIDNKRGLISLWSSLVENSPNSGISLFFLDNDKINNYKKTYLDPNPHVNQVRKEVYEQRKNGVSDLTNLKDRDKEIIEQYLIKEKPRKALDEMKSLLSNLTKIIHDEFDINMLRKMVKSNE